ncbi:MAG: glycosyltransferase [Bacilli bacterium]
MASIEENDIDIVIPVYNEKGSIECTLRELGSNVKQSIRVIIVYDMDEDTTIPIVNSIAGSLGYPVVMQKNIYGRGALNAIKSGMALSEADAVLVVMADMSDDLGMIDLMYEKFQEGYDIVCGSRYMRGGRQIGGPLLKKILSRTAGLTLHYLARIPTHDVTNSFKMYRKSLLEDLRIESVGGFEIGMEITVKAHLAGRLIAEIPVTWTDRTDGESKFKLWKWIPHYFHWYSRAFGRRSKVPAQDAESHNA